MFSKLRISLALALMLSLPLVIPAFAGGWAVITLDEWPSNIVAGKPVTIGFTVLQHGRTPMTDLEPTITANLYKDQEFVATARPQGKPGHYTATLTFPKEGEWRWSIQAFAMDQAMPDLSVAAPTAAKNDLIPEPALAAFTITPIQLTGMAILILSFLSALIGLRRKSRPVTGFTILCLLAGLGLLIAAGTNAQVEAQAKSEVSAAGAAAIDQVELGRNLFVAKGCLTCHANSKATSLDEYWTVPVAPDLTRFSASPEVLRLRLTDPKLAKSNTLMPDLNLSDSEIEALIAFINSK